MLRQRLRLRRSPLRFLGRGLLALVCLGLIYAGAMVLALALKADPATINSLCGYRDAFDFLSGLGSADITDEVRLVTGLAGLAAFLIFGLLAFKELPRPHLARSSVTVHADQRGRTDVSPRALERVAELAATAAPAVSASACRLEDDTMLLNVRVGPAGEAPAALAAARAGAREALETHGVPVGAVDATIAGIDNRSGSTRRELS